MIATISRKQKQSDKIIKRFKTSFLNFLKAKMRWKYLLAVFSSNDLTGTDNLTVAQTPCEWGCKESSAAKTSTAGSATFSRKQKTCHLVEIVFFYVLETHSCARATSNGSRFFAKTKLAIVSNYNWMNKRIQAF